jgi:hypothetical protein
MLYMRKTIIKIFDSFLLLVSYSYLSFPVILYLFILSITGQWTIWGQQRAYSLLHTVLNV